MGVKVLACEMCGSQELVKQDGLYVCQSCGAKYTVEEAKKMMVEGIVDVSGSTIKVDNTSSIENYYKMAESAYKANNLKESETYCNKIIEIDPNNYKAWILKSKVAGWQSTLANIRIDEAMTCYTNAISESSSAPDGEKLNMAKEFAVELNNICTALLNMACSNFEELPTESNEQTINMMLDICESCLQLIGFNGADYLKEFKNNVGRKLNLSSVAAWKNVVYKEYHEEQYPSKYVYQRFNERFWSCKHILEAALEWTDDNSLIIQIYKNIIVYLKEYVKSCSYEYYNGAYHVSTCLTDQAKDLNINEIMKCHTKIHELDPNYVIPKRPARPGHSGCYVATCVYGSYDCPQVWTLRRYRDYTLAETWYGRAFIRTYYAISPSIVKWFGKTSWFKKMWKGKLDKMVENLQSKGVESTPYEDRQW